MRTFDPLEQELNVGNENTITLEDLDKSINKSEKESFKIKEDKYGFDKREMPPLERCWYFIFRCFRKLRLI